MTPRIAGFALIGSLALAACGQTGTDPAVTTAPPSASNAKATDPATTPAGAPADSLGSTAAATPAYQQDTAEPADKIAGAAPADDALARCRELDTAQRGDCELQARQGLDVQQSGVLDPVSEQQTPPTDRVPADGDVTAAQDDDDRE